MHVNKCHSNIFLVVHNSLCVNFPSGFHIWYGILIVLELQN
jgi:hypothetical protein